MSARSTKSRGTARSTNALRLVLGDQLSEGLSALSDIDPLRDRILMCEVIEEATYVPHHRKKIALVFSAMRHFAISLERKGFRVDYIALDDTDNQSSITGQVIRAVEKWRPKRVVATHPGEYRVLECMKKWPDILPVPVEIREDDRFLISIGDFEEFTAKRQSLRMENFYRMMRKRLSLLMEGDNPVGGKWNLDSENRKSLPADIEPPQPIRFKPDRTTREVIELVKSRFPSNFGDLSPFDFAVTRRQALKALNDFIENRIEHFGDYQDAMKQGQPSLFHSQLSFYLNIGLLEPRELLQTAETAYREGRAPLNAVEGFIRQIAGWREFVRGVYWSHMPEYKNQNFFNARRRLPAFYWTCETRMNCLAQCIDETRRFAYAHHIQRLMVLGNFALLCGIDPSQVNEWFLVVYADAYEWVELPNVTGMILYADAGLLASKPYAAGGAYINRMSDYCRECHYSVSRKDGESACPFNYMYWDFLDRNRKKLKQNPRLGMPYRTLERMQETKKKRFRSDAARFLEKLDAGEFV